jgi:outer membrane protein assembly factor BamB
MGVPSHDVGALTRRGLLAAGGALAIGAAEAQAARAVPRTVRRRLASAPVTGSWPLPAHDLSATRHGAPLTGVKELWRASFPGGVPASAAVLGDRVYAASAKGEVAALSLRDGKPAWRVSLGAATYGSGKAVRKLGFFGGVAASPAGVIVASERAHCLDPVTGATRWVAAALRTSTSDDYFWGAPVLVNGVALIGSGSGGEVPTARGHLTAYRVADGKLLWSTALAPPSGNGAGVIGPASVDPRAGVVYVATGAPYQKARGSNPGTCSLIALRLSTGAVIWHDQVFPGNSTGFDFNSAPVIVGRRLFATNKDGIFAWDRVDRRRLWHTRITDPLAGGLKSAGPTGGPEGGPIATDGRRVYALSNDLASQGCVAAALAPTDGKVLWRTPLPAPTFAAPALAGSELCVAGSDGTLRVLGSATGKILASTVLGQPSSAAPALANGRLFVGLGAQPYIPGNSLVCIG